MICVSIAEPTVDECIKALHNIKFAEIRMDIIRDISTEGIDKIFSLPAKLVATCRAYGLRPIDGPFGDFNDPDGYVNAAKRGAAIGIEGKWAIHPSQIEYANDVFSPPAKEVEKAHRIIEELKKAAAEGKGAAQLDGRMIDAASEKMAENIININNLIESKK